MLRSEGGGRAVATDAADEHPHEEPAMKRTRKQEQDRQQRLGGTARGLTEADLAQIVGGDLYIFNPRGSHDSSGSGG
jgi:hypothetical protein